MAVQYISPEKYEELGLELKELRLQKMPDLAKRIDDARQLGDLSENAEYHAAREEMAWTQSRMKEIQYILDNAEMIEEGSSGDAVGLGSTVVVEYNGVKRELQIVGAQEADPMNGRISNDSPLGHAFFGHKKGDKVEVEVPAGKQMYKIVQVK
jgi:transcription elongation factor GreA